MADQTHLATIRGIPIMPNISGSLPFTQGNIWHVKPGTGSDGNTGYRPDQAVASLSKALGYATANQNDIVLLYYESNTAASTSDYQTAALDWNKDGVHLIGVGGGSMIGQRARIAQKSTTLTIEDLFTVSANNCMIANLEIYQGVASSTAVAPRAMVVSGMRNRIVNCQISGIGDLSMDVSGARSLAVTGQENNFQHCYIGLDTVLRTTSLGEMEIVAAATRCLFEDCIINSYTATTTYKAVLMNTTGSSAHTGTWFKNTMFTAAQNRTGVGVPTGAIIFTYAGSVFLMGCGVFGYADTSTLANANIYVLSYPASASGANLAVDMGVGKGATPA